MKTFKEYDAVKIVKLLEANRSYNWRNSISRLPRTGDIGMMVDILRERTYIVEMTDSKGQPIWLADFLEEELELARNV
jgi:hypothetical protein